MSRLTLGRKSELRDLPFAWRSRFWGPADACSGRVKHSRSRFGRLASSWAIVGTRAIAALAPFPTQPPQEGALQQFGVEPVGLNPAPILSSKSEYTIETEAGAPFEVRPLNFSNGEVEAAYVAAFESQPLRKTAGRCLLGCDCEHVR